MYEAIMVGLVTVSYTHLCEVEDVTDVAATIRRAASATSVTSSTS